ncbi:MAG: putative lipase [Polyangiaceae bacterium]|nr:putative lipase [Polyangiaceae bacterium]
MSGSSRWRALANAGKEVAAWARQASLIHLDVLEPAIPKHAEDGDDIVVLLHGLFATAGVLRPLRRSLARHRRVHTAAMTYAPGPGVEELAHKLKHLAGELPEKARLHLVGHSLGGIVARYFAQEIGDPRVLQTISLASPFAGVRRAALLGFGGARDLDPQSGLLRRLRLGASNTTHPAPVSHALPGGEVLLMEGRGHNALLYDAEVAGHIERRILAIPRPRATHVVAGDS